MRSHRSPWLWLALLAAGTSAGMLATNANAFCGFYVSGSGEQLTNKATRVALMRQGTRTVLSMSNDYDGPPQNFAMVVPVPVVLQRENVRTLPHDIFTHLESLTAPRLVEYWEQDPCYVPPPMPPMMMVPTTAAMPPPTPSPARNQLGVRIEAQFVVGEYEVVVLSATQSTGLETWLRQERYNIPQGAAQYLAPYVREQWKFFVARVNIQRVQRRPNGGARLSPLRFHYDTPEFRLPVRLGLMSAPPGQPQDLIVYVMHQTARFETANYRSVTIPTNLDVTEEVRSRFGEFYTRLFDETIAQNGGRVVVTEYAWETGSCDPCPTPPMQSGEMATLGGDVLPGAGPNAPVAQSMVVTRLHTRYDRNTLTEDLVFREAPGIVGGREHVIDANGTLERGSQASSYNNFQARYAIRHPWTGPIRCNNPVRNRWGGPPNGSQPQTIAARDLADITNRTALSLPAVVRTPIPELRVVPAAAPAPGGVRTPVRVPLPGARKTAGSLGILLGPRSAGSEAEEPQVEPSHRGGRAPRSLRYR